MATSLEDIRQRANAHLKAAESGAIELGVGEMSDTWNYATYAKHLSVEEAQALAKGVKELIAFIDAEKFDFVVISGSSRLIIKSLLVGKGLEHKLVELKPDENYCTYARNDAEPDFSVKLDQQAYQQRAAGFKEIFETRTHQSLEGLKVAILDDHVSRGYKLRELISVFKALDCVCKFQFLSLTGPYDSTVIRKVVGDDDYDQYFHFFVDWEKKPQK